MITGRHPRSHCMHSIPFRFIHRQTQYTVRRRKQILNMGDGRENSNHLTRIHGHAFDCLRMSSSEAWVNSMSLKLPETNRLPSIAREFSAMVGDALEFQCDVKWTQLGSIWWKVRMTQLGFATFQICQSRLEILLLTFAASILQCKRRWIQETATGRDHTNRWNPTFEMMLRKYLS